MNGCGKTHLVRSLFQKELSTVFEITINLTNFICEEEFFEKISMYYESFFKKSFPTSYSQILQNNYVLKDWKTLYDFIEGSHNYIPVYFIVDEINEVNYINHFKKFFSKLLVLSNFDNVNFIFISNFDIKKSELKYVLNLTSFISLCFPGNDRKTIQNIAEEKFRSILKVTNNSQSYKDIISKTVSNFEYRAANLNEITYNTEENLKRFCKSVYRDITQVETNDQTFCEYEDNLIKNSKNEIGELNTAVKNQLDYTPIHVVNFKGPDQKLSKRHVNINITPEYLATQDVEMHTNLSVSQKLLALSSFLASGIPSSQDFYKFREVKRGFKKIKKDNPCSIKYGNSLTFNVHRLFSIYFYLHQVIFNDAEEKKNNISVEVISDVRTIK